MFPTPIQDKSQAVQKAYPFLIVSALLVWLLPLAAMLLTSFRSMADMSRGNYWGLPTEWMMIENYTAVFTTTPMGRFLFNSILITVPTVVGALALSCLAAFALAKYQFKAATPLFALFIAGNFIPFQILMIPVRNLSLELNLYDTFMGLILFHVAFQSGFCTLFMRNFIKALPDSLIEAARVDGAGEFRIFFVVVLPLVRPALAALAVLTFTFVWNDYFWALVLVKTDTVQPVTAGIQSLRGQWSASWHLISAGAIIAALPPVAMFFFMQKHFIAGLTMGATKG